MDSHIQVPKCTLYFVHCTLEELVLLIFITTSLFVFRGAGLFCKPRLRTGWSTAKYNKQQLKTKKPTERGTGRGEKLCPF